MATNTFNAFITISIRRTDIDTLTPVQTAALYTILERLGHAEEAQYLNRYGSALVGAGEWRALVADAGGSPYGPEPLVDVLPDTARTAVGLAS